MTYTEFIQNILDTRGRFNCGEEYCERHHIIPKCCNGSNNEENLIDLYAREHFIAHKLLAEENPSNTKIILAWHCMSIMENKFHQRYEVTSEEYEEMKIAHRQSLMGENNYWYGKHPNDNTREKMRQSWDYNKHFSAEIREKMGKSRVGNKNPKARKVAQYTKDGVLIKIWDCLSDAARETSANLSKICECCSETSRRKSAGGFIWKYADDEVEDIISDLSIYKDNRFKKNIS